LGVINEREKSQMKEMVYTSKLEIFEALEGWEEHQDE
jgi:hypothetical protein